MLANYPVMVNDGMFLVFYHLNYVDDLLIVKSKDHISKIFA